jgi:hypothetical protein
LDSSNVHVPEKSGFACAEVTCGKARNKTSAAMSAFFMCISSPMNTTLNVGALRPVHFSSTAS